jgi:hypothetical protein
VAGPRRRGLRGRYWRWVFRGAEQRVVDGLPVGIRWSQAGAAEILLPKLDAALGLIAAYDSRRFERLLRDVEGILVTTVPGVAAKWEERARLVLVSDAYVADAGTSPAHLASTLVHEGTHAWLWRLGFGDEEVWRARVEAICYRSEFAFARRLPQRDVALECELEAALRADPAEWSDAAIRERKLQAIHSLGVPRWMARIIVLVFRLRAA